MKTHIPTKLRKALIAALFAVSSVAYNAQAEPVDLGNSSTGYAETGGLGYDKYSTGYTDLTFSGTGELHGVVTHWCHDGDYPFPSSDNRGDDTYIVLATDAGGRYVARSIAASLGKDDNSTIVFPYHNHEEYDENEFGYSSSWSNGNINVTDRAIIEVTSHITANGTLGISGSSNVTSEGSVSAGAINVTGSQLTAKTIIATDTNTLWVVEGGVRKDDIKTSGALTVQDATVNATNITVADAVYGSNGIIKGLPDSDLTVSGKILTENAKYVASNGYAVKVGTIGDIYNAGTVAEPDWTVRGNNNRFGYKEDGTSVLASRVEVNGDVVSDGNKIAATGSNLVPGTPAISITGTVGRTDEATGPADGNELYAMKGDISVGALADNTNLTILAEDGGVEIKDASAATVKDSSITAADDVVIAANAEGSNAKLNLIKTDVTSEDGDITANQVLVMENGTLSAENGDVTAVGLNGKAASVHAINLEAGNIKLDADASSTADIVLTGDMTSTEESILIKGYNGEKLRVTVDGNMTAQQALDIMGSNVSVGKDQKSVASGISVSESTLAVGGSQEAATTIDISTSTVDIAGDEKAGTHLGVHGSTLTVGGDQTAGTSMAIDSGSKVTVGHEDEETGELVGGNQTAKMNITIEESDVTVLADQTSTDGSIVIRDLDDSQNPTIVKVEGNQKAKTDITATGAELTVGTIEEIENELTGEKTYELSGGNQTAETGDISLTNSTADILGHQEAAAGNIIVAGSTLTVGAKTTDGEIVQASNQTAQNDITITDSDVTVLGNEIAGNHISVTDSIVTVDGDQTATNGSITIKSTGTDGATPSKVTIGGDQKAGIQIKVVDSTLTVGTIETIEDEETGEITYELHGGNQTADSENILISGSKVAVLGDQTATEGNIDIIKGSDLVVGAIAEDGEIVQESNQLAKNDITISDSNVRVLGDQTATEGNISIIDQDAEKNPTVVLVEGNQKAGQGISVTRSTLTVGIIEEIEDEETGEITYELNGGNQTAETGDIMLEDSTVDVLGHQKAVTGSISVDGSTLTVGAVDPNGKVIQASNQTAAQDITITDSEVTVLGNEIAGTDITITDSIVKVDGDQAATAGSITIQSTGNEGTTPSEVTIGGDQLAGTDITVTDSIVKVDGDQAATDGSITITTTEGSTTPSEVTIGGDQLAGNGISVEDATLTVGTIEETTTPWGWPVYALSGGNQTAETGDITISHSDVNVLGDQTAETGAISVTKGSDLTVGCLDPNGFLLHAGNQTAETDITITDSDVHVLGDQTATTGKIAISVTDPELYSATVTVDGDQLAGNGISVDDSTLTVGVVREFTDMWGNTHYWLTGGNQTAENGNISIDGSVANILGNQEATEGNISVANGSTLTVGALDPNGEVVQASNQLAKNDITITDSQVTVLGDQTAVEGGIKIDKLSLVTIGTVDVDGTVLAGNQLAKQDIEIDSSTLMVMDNQTSQEGSISVQALDDFSLVMVGGSQTAKKDIGIFGSKEHETPTTVLVGEDQIAGEGNIAINDAQVSVNGKVVALGDGTDGTGIVALAGATYDVGVSLQAKELNIGTIDNPSAVTINVESLDADGNPLDTVLDVDKLTVEANNTLHTGNVKMDAADVTIKGAVEVGVKDADPEKAIAANWDTEGTHLISGEGASLKANGNIRIAAAEGDTVTINDGATVAATGDVTIQGQADTLAVVDNARMTAKGDLTFSNAALSNNAAPQIKSTEGDIVLKDKVEIADTQLNILAPEGTEPGSIVVEKGADVQLYQGTVDVFNGKLAGTGSVAANDENLLLYKDASAFNGNINMNRGGDQTLLITNGTGVGANATLALHNGADLETINTTGEMQQPQLGNVVATGAGSDITLNGGVAGDTARATSLSLTDGTTLNVDSTQGEAGLVADSIVGTQKIDAQGARVAVHSTTDMEITPDGTRHTVVGLAEGGTIASGFNEDVLYDMNGVQRTLQTRNMHLEHTAHGVDLVLSENYKGIDNRNTNAVAVRDVILPLDAAADHRPGVLAGSASQLDHVLDALDYTRSGADAREGLLSLSGAANLIVPNMMMDASRHHLSALRDHMSAPVCTDNRKTKGNVWAAYTGGYDHIGGDENMHGYSHSYQGALVGGDYAVNCNWAVGLSLGYQKSIARTDGTRADADAFSGDLYAVGRTGKYTHRFSMGLTSYSTDVKRGTRIAAAGHTYHGQSTGSADGMSWNFGYQLSRNFAINGVSTITPYLTVDVALQRIDTLNEKGQGDASLVTDYEDFVQTDAALGVAYSHTFTSFNRQTGVFSVNLAAHGEFSEHRATAKNHFAGCADTWKTRSMKRAPFYGELGADVVVPFGQHISGTAGVNFEFSADRTFVGGHAGVNYRF